MTTYAQWVTGLAGLTVTGVVKKQAYPPQQVNDADLPLLFPRLPTGGNEVIALTGGMGLKEATAELVILTRPGLLSTQKTEFPILLGLLDAVETTLTAAVLTWGLDRWSVRVEDITLGDGATIYRAIIATVEGTF